jgi:ATP-dependent Clp protease ATP-binding subunit ClpA
MSKTPVPFAPETLETIQRAFRIASDRRHEEVGLEHLLLAITDEPQARRVLTSCGAELDVLRRQLTDVLAKAFTPIAAPAVVEPEPTLGFDRVIQQAMMHAVSSSAKHVESGSLLVFLLQEEDSHAAYFLRSQGVERLLLLRVLSHGSKNEPATAPTGEPGAPSTDPLQAFASDLVARAAAGQIDPLIGRALEIERMVQVLCRRRKNNPLLVGEPGVGKTALAEGLALRIHQGEVPDVLKGARVFALDLGANVRRHNRDPRACAQQRFELARSDTSATHQHHAPRLEVEKCWEHGTHTDAGTFKWEPITRSKSASERPICVGAATRSRTISAVL